MYLSNEYSPTNTFCYRVFEFNTQGQVLQISLGEGRCEILRQADISTFISQEKTFQREVYLFVGRKAACGLFGVGDDYIEKYQSLDERFVKNKASTFFFEAVGESMSPLILPKDILIVDRSLEVINNSIVVAHVNGMMMCKRFYKQNQRVILKSDNPSNESIIVTEEMNLIVFGVVRGIAREL